MKIGDKVKTEHGTGEVVGFDLPESIRTTRVKVKIEKENKDNNIAVSLFPDQVLCYFPKEVTKI